MARYSPRCPCANMCSRYDHAACADLSLQSWSTNAGNDSLHRLSSRIPHAQWSGLPVDLHSNAVVNVLQRCAALDWHIALHRVDESGVPQEAGPDRIECEW